MTSVVREIRSEDFPAFKELVFTANASMMSMPKDEELLRKRVEEAVQAFSSPGDKGALYLFVLEEQGRLIGCSGILATTGHQAPYYYYKMGSERHHITPFSFVHDVATLNVLSHTEGPAEMCSLYILPQYRLNGHGRLISLSRFFYILQHPEAFHAHVFALLRGIADTAGNSPFWEDVGKKYCPRELGDVLKAMMSSEEFIIDILPRHPLYIPLLSAAAQSVIGKPHPDAMGAWNMLHAEGFRFDGEVDYLDAGPKLSAHIPDVRIVKESHLRHVADVVDTWTHDHRCLIARMEGPFRATAGDVKESNGDEVVVSRDVAEALQIHPGDLICFATAKGK